MAYETEKNRLAALLTAGSGVPRTRDSDLEREADERAREARSQTGLTFGDGVGEDFISHPTLAVRQSRLGVPATVPVAELATWNYLWSDPVEAAANGLLNSPDHRAVLVNPLWDYWGIGIYTEMPQGESNELFRRWWFILWFADRPIGAEVEAKPSEVLSRIVEFRGGPIYGYKFDWRGNILSTKSGTFSVSKAKANGRGTIPNRSGTWLRIADGVFAGHWVREDGFITLPHTRLT